ncbi:hypothetical protein [Streptomyces griseus]|uniref:hypothetical protein n=1 Tax=Streptomyces griseus TaxID=1911 RepID=UPI0004C954FA|nr:hypothetical protein [Streptomyces griseus]
MARNEERRHRNDPGPRPGRPLRLAPGVGERRGADGVLRRYLDPGATLFLAPTARRAVNSFVRERAKDLGTEGADLREVGKDQGKQSLHVRYQQFHQDIPIRGATLQMVADTARAAVVQVENTTETDVSDAPEASEARAADVVEKAALAPFGKGYGTAAVIRDDLVYLRDASRPPLPEADSPTATIALLRQGRRRPDGRLHLVHDLVVETTGPFEHFRVVVDAVSGKLLWIEVAGRYVTATLKVYVPDPVTESDDGTLSSLSGDDVLKAFSHEVQTEIAEADGAGNFHLDGDWCRCVDWDAPDFPQPESATPSFVFDTHPEDKAFLSANAYYWIDAFARYLRGLDSKQLNLRMTKVDVDPQGAQSTDKSEWIGTTDPPRMRFDMKLVPGAADLGIIVHEYTHGVVQWLRPGATAPLEYEHSICDVMAGIYRDRFNPAGNRRTETFPFDNNAQESWSKDRRLDLTQRFDDPAFGTYGPDLRTGMLASALWQCYLGMGGSSKDGFVREAAADKMIRVLLEMVPRLGADGAQSRDNAVHLADICVAADTTVHGGLHKNVMRDAFVRQGLFPKPDIDVFIADRVGDTGDVPSGGDDDPFWTSPDIWVRHDPDGDTQHEEPIMNRPNNLYVRVHNRGTDDAQPDTFTVETRRCNPGTGMTWPTHFKVISTELIHDTIPAGGSVRVGPFAWTPTIPDHECLIAVVHGADDPAVDATSGEPIAHDKLVRFDNNVGQRNVYPKPSTLGGQTRMEIRLNGGPAATEGAWELDATAMPPDTQITVRTLSRIVRSSELSDIVLTETGDVRSTLRMKGGDTAVVQGFRLDAEDEVTADVTIDFSHEAVHLKAYDLVSTQIQDHQVAGRLTIEITAVKDLHEWFFGNRHTKEVHIDTCPYWNLIGEASKVPFPTIDLALAYAYDGCAYCLPQFDHPQD